MTLLLIFKRIVNPSKTALVLWSIIISPVLLVYLYQNSFDWLIGVRDFMKIMLGLLIIMNFIFYALDYFFKIAIKKYSLLSLAIWIVICALFFPAKILIEKGSEKKAIILIDAVENYKAKFGDYPEGLFNQNFASYPMRSYMGTFYYYETHVRDSNKYFILYYYTFNGRMGRYSSRDKKWEYYEDD